MHDLHDLSVHCVRILLFPPLRHYAVFNGLSPVYTFAFSCHFQHLFQIPLEFSVPFSFSVLYWAGYHLCIHYQAQVTELNSRSLISVVPQLHTTRGQPNISS
jgi:hypothetical protein